MNYPIFFILAGAFSAYLFGTLVASAIYRAGFELPPESKRIGCIDGLRGYLALSVLAHHFIIWMQVDRFGVEWSAPTVAFFNELGKGSVALFFMATGFVFYPRILKGLRRTHWPSIYVGRIFRIIPLVFASVLAVTWIIYLRTGVSIDLGYVIPLAKWVTSFSQPPLLDYPDSKSVNARVLWSLWLEWTFYLLVLPVCSGAMDLARGRAPSWLIPLNLLLLSFVANIMEWPYEIFIYLPLFAVGMLAYELQSRDTIARNLRKPLATTASVFALVLGMTFFHTPYTYAVPFFGFFFTCVASGNCLWGILRTKGALVLGECSFGIYLLHGLLLNIAFVDLNEHYDSLSDRALPLTMSAFALLAVLLSAATYLAIEKPFMVIGKRLSVLVTNRERQDIKGEVRSAP